jgi:hypothetical protein
LKSAGIHRRAHSSDGCTGHDFKEYDMQFTKNLTAAVVASALVGTIGFAYAQTTTTDPATPTTPPAQMTPPATAGEPSTTTPATPPSQSTMPATQSAPSMPSSTDAAPAEPAPQADRN